MPAMHQQPEQSDLLITHDKSHLYKLQGKYLRSNRTSQKDQSATCAQEATAFVNEF
jgi:hypothetical protein